MTEHAETSAGITYDAVVLAGGRATRLGGTARLGETAKAGLVVEGERLLDRALTAGSRARATVVVGPPELADALTGIRPRPALTQEDPPFGGPVAGLAAGLRALPAAGAPWVLVLAVDVPRAAGAISLLEQAVSREPTDGAYLVREGRAQWLVGIYRRTALASALTGIEPAGASMKRLVGELRCAEVPDRAGWSEDIDTPADAERLGAATDDHRKDPR